MFEYGRRPHTLCVRSVVKTLTIVTITVAITVPCIRLGGAIARTSGASGTVDRKTDGRPEVEIRGERLTVSLAAEDAAGSNTAEEPEKNRNSTSVDVKHRKRPIGGELVKRGVFRDGRSGRSFRFPTSKNRGAPYSVVRSMSITPYSIDRFDNETATATDVDDGNHESNVNPVNSRLNHRQLNSYGDSTTQTNTQTVGKDSAINNNNYQNTHGGVSIEINGDLKESAGDSKNEKYRTAIFKREQIFSELLTATTENGVSGPPFKLGTRYSANGNNENRFDPMILSKQAGEILNEYYSPTYGTYYGTQPIPEPDGGSPIVIPNVQPPVISQPPTVPQPPVLQPPVLQPPDQTAQRPLSTAENNGNWQIIGLILAALVKLSMVKIKAIGFLKPLFFLLFKLKFTMAALFFKFLLSLKLLLFFKLQVLPLVLLASLPILVSLVHPVFAAGLFSLPGQIINTILGRVDTAAIPTGAGASADVSGTSGAVANAQNPIKTIPDTLINPFGLLKGRSFKSRELLDYPTLDIFQKALGLEKCVARIACEIIAFAEKSGIIPLWINEVSRQVTTFFPNKISEAYLKTYNEENNETHTKVPSTDIWTTRCLENYGCNNFNTTNMTDKKQ